MAFLAKWVIEENVSLPACPVKRALPCRARLLEQGRGGVTRQGPAPQPFALYLLAAKQGDKEAMQRLVKVFEQGELGQAASALRAALWREKLRHSKTP